MDDVNKQRRNFISFTVLGYGAWEFNSRLQLFKKVDSAIHRINLYPVDSVIGFPNTYPLDGDLFG